MGTAFERCAGLGVKHRGDAGASRGRRSRRRIAAHGAARRIARPDREQGHPHRLVAGVGRKSVRRCRPAGRTHRDPIGHHLAFGNARHQGHPVPCDLVQNRDTGRRRQIDQGAREIIRGIDDIARTDRKALRARQQQMAAATIGMRGHAQPRQIGRNGARALGEFGPFVARRHRGQSPGIEQIAVARVVGIGHPWHLIVFPAPREQRIGADRKVRLGPGPDLFEGRQVIEGCGQGQPIALTFGMTVRVLKAVNHPPLGGQAQRFPRSPCRLQRMIDRNRPGEAVRGRGPCQARQGSTCGRKTERGNKVATVHMRLPLRRVISTKTSAGITEKRANRRVITVNSAGDHEA